MQVCLLLFRFSITHTYMGINWLCHACVSIGVQLQVIGGHTDTIYACEVSVLRLCSVEFKHFQVSAQA